jgi:hypothetical protein
MPFMGSVVIQVKVRLLSLSRPSTLFSVLVLTVPPELLVPTAGCVWKSSMTNFPVEGGSLYSRSTTRRGEGAHRAEPLVLPPEEVLGSHAALQVPLHHRPGSSPSRWSGRRGGR